MHDQTQRRPRFQLMASGQPTLTPRSAHVQGQSWMPSNHSAASMDVLPSHLPSEANAPPSHTSADRIAPQPHLAILSLPSNSPSPTKKLPVDVRGESVLHALLAIDGRHSRSSSVRRASLSSLIQGEYHRLGGDPVTNSGRSACDVLQHSCRPAAKGKFHPHRRSTTASGNSLKALPNFAERPGKKISPTSDSSNSSRGCNRASSYA